MRSLRKFISRIATERHPFALWNFFFLLEIALYLFGAIRLDLTLNLLFLGLILLPSPQVLTRYRSVRIGRVVATLMLALLLLWHQSWLPTPSQVYHLLNLYGLPSFDYMLTFFKGMFTMTTLLSLFLLMAISLLMSKKRLVSMAVLPIALVVAPFISAQLSDTDEKYSLVGISTAEAAGMDPARYLQGFYAAEAERKITFPNPEPAPGEVPFDIAVLHLCSLSWDDMKTIGMSYDSPFFSQFDYLFTNFNTATGYSTPAVRRLLQANCGQRSHKDVHDDTPPEVCLLFNSLDAAGYKTFVGMSHDGEYGNFLNTIDKLTPKDTTIIPLKGLEQQAIFFDGKVALYNDYDVLERWTKARESSKRTALYYNSVLLHAGIRWVGEKRSRNDRDQFIDVTTALLEDVQAFIDSLKNSNRNTVVVFVPEHGRALIGSTFQPADVRDIPLPKITKVPVGIKLIGPKFNNKKVQQNIVSKPTSYQAIAWMLSRYVENSPFSDNAPSADAMAFQIPRTEFVAEHEGRVVMEMDGKFLYRHTDGEWTTLTARQLE